MRPDARGPDTEGITLSRLSVGANRPGLPEISASARGPVRRLPAERAEQGTIVKERQGTLARVGHRVPNPDRAVVDDRGEEPAVRAESDLGNHHLMTR